jgi:hypothetical protein
MYAGEYHCCGWCGSHHSAQCVRRCFVVKGSVAAVIGQLSPQPTAKSVPRSFPLLKYFLILRFLHLSSFGASEVHRATSGPGVSISFHEVHPSNQPAQSCVAATVGCPPAGRLLSFGKSTISPFTNKLLVGIVSTFAADPCHSVTG